MWYRIDETPPPIGVEIDTKIEDARGTRNMQPLKFDGNLWWTGGMYVYYTPTHWRIKRAIS